MIFKLGLTIITIVIVAFSLGSPVSADSDPCLSFKGMSQFYNCKGDVTPVDGNQDLIYLIFEKEVPDTITSAKWDTTTEASMWCRKQSRNRKENCKKYVDRYANRLIDWRHRHNRPNTQPAPPPDTGVIQENICNFDCEILPPDWPYVIEDGELVNVLLDNGYIAIDAQTPPPDPQNFNVFEPRMIDTGIDPETGRRWECWSGWFYEGSYGQAFPGMGLWVRCAYNYQDEDGISRNPAEDFFTQMFNAEYVRDLILEEIAGSFGAGPSRWAIFRVIISANMPVAG